MLSRVSQIFLIFLGVSVVMLISREYLCCEENVVKTSYCHHFDVDSFLSPLSYNGGMLGMNLYKIYKN